MMTTWAAAPELLINGDWGCLNIEATTTWPVRPQSLVFAGHVVWLIPLTIEDHPGVATNRPRELPREEAESILYRLPNVIAWRENMGIAVACSSGGNLPRMMGLVAIVNTGNDRAPIEDPLRSYRVGDESGERPLGNGTVDRLDG